MKSDEVALPVPSNSTASFAPTLADASQNLAKCVGPRMCEYSQDRQPSGGFPELEATTPNSKCPGPQEARNKNASEEPHPSQEKAITSNKDALEELGPSQQKPMASNQDALEELHPSQQKPVASNQDALQEPSPRTALAHEVKELSAVPWHAEAKPQQEAGVQSDSDVLMGPETSYGLEEPPMMPPPKVPLLSDMAQPSPPRNSPSLTPGAIDRRMRRVFTPKANGEFKVSSKFVAEWQKGGAQRKSLQKVMASCGYDPDPSLLMQLLWRLGFRGSCIYEACAFAGSLHPGIGRNR